MAEHTGMFAKALAVVRDHDDPGPVEDGTTLELVNQPSQLFIKVGDAVVVGIASQSDLPRGKPELDQRVRVLTSAHWP